MKKRLAALAVALILLGMVAAVALGGSAGDPLVTLSYLENQYLTDLLDGLRQRAAQGTAPIYDDAVSRLDRLGEADLEEAQGVRGGDYRPAEFRRGDALDLKEGASLVLFGGKASLTAGTLADVTAGASLTAEAELEAGHRYIVTSSDPASVQMTADGSAGYAGDVTLREAPVKEFNFTDVTEQDWYYSAIVYVYNRSYFAGTGETTFEPLTSMNRAMLATVLHRVAGEPRVTGEPAFTDVPQDQWYTKGIVWASESRVVNGMGDGTYAPFSPVTREQMVTMLYRYYTNCVAGESALRGDLSAFPDGGQVSEWARDAVEWAVGQGIIRGRDTGDLDPAGTATRAEVAIIIQRFVLLLEG